MSETIVVNYENKPCYEILMEHSFARLQDALIGLDCGEKKLCIVTDSTVAKYYLEAVEEVARKVSKQVIHFIFPAGEESKNLDTVKALYTTLIKGKFDRKDMLLALGGGVVGDMTGFTAATYLRGIDFIQIPTTLLAQVDSSIGGKTGVDFDQYKNMVGAFKMPRLVYMNMDTLQTLEPRQFFSGFAEAMKHGLIKDSHYYEWMLDHIYEICDRDPATLEKLVLESCKIKKAVVEKDPTEKGDRALLNFGHTIGHAIEKKMNFSLLHGECVALGCVAAAYISYQRKLLTFDEYYEIRDMFVPFNLPITITDIDPEEIINITKLDKKMEKGQIKFVLLKKIGKAFVDKTVTEEEMKAGIEEIVFRDENE